MESAKNSLDLPGGFQPGASPEPDPGFGGDNQGVNGLSIRSIDQDWAEVRGAVSEQASAALNDYSEIHSFPLGSLITACWAELIRCYRGDDSAIRLRIAHSADRPGGIFDVSIPAAAGGSVRDRLSKVTTSIEAAAESGLDASQGTATNELTSLGDKLSIGTVIRVHVERGSFELDGNGGHVLAIEASNGANLELRARYKTAHFNAAFIQRLLGCLGHMLQQLPALDSWPISELQLVPPTQIHSVSDGPAIYGTSCVHEKICEQSRRSPSRIAVVRGQEQVTYAELNRRANELARYLIEQGAGPDSLVAVHLDRSIDLLIALLGVLKSGAAFLPLDTSLPKGRVEGILRESECPIVVTCSQLAASFWDSGARVVFTDSERESWQHESGDDFPSPAGLNNLAYVTYTSGSTGTPKGVMIEHRHLLASFAGMDEVLGTNAGIWLASSNISFDIAVTELLWTLVHGFRIVLHEGDEGTPVVSGPQSIVAQMREHGVTHFQGTPTLIRMLLSDPASAKAFAGLRKLLVGGEPFPPSVAADLLGTMSGDVFNMYGPTETTICATYHLVKRVQDPMPIGRPTINSRVYVLDKAGRIVPPLAPGELFIGGDAVGRGYFRRSELTNERFGRDPFSDDRNARMYRTGDLVRMALDGTLEFLDRMDSQVKLRGFRIELGELESALRAHPAIEDAAVVVRGAASGDKTLAGFFTVRPGFDVLEDEVTRHLMGLLPSYMVPPSITRIESFPVTPNGKTDRAKLAAGEVSRREPVLSDSSTPGAAGSLESPPRDPKLCDIESTLCLWCGELLKVPGITATMDFFEIGGQSLVAAQLAQRIAKRYRTHIRLSTFLKVRTMRGLAELVYQDGGGSWSPVIEVRTTGAKAPLVLIAGLTGSVVNFELLSRFLGEDRPIYAVETQGTDKNSATLTSVEEMARSYLEEVRRIQPQGPYYLCGYSFGGLIAFEMAQQLRAAGQELGIVGLIDMPEWHYTRRVMGSLGTLERFQILHGGAVRRLLFGPNRTKAFFARLEEARDYCRVTLDRLLGRRGDSSVASTELRNLHAMARYAPKFYAGDIHLFRCPDPSRFRDGDPLLGWGGMASRIIVTEIPGEHGLLTAEPFVSFLGDALRQSLDSLEAWPARKPNPSRAIRTNEIPNRLVTSV